MAHDGARTKWLELGHTGLRAMLALGERQCSPVARNPFETL